MNERELIAERTIYAIDKDSRGFEIRLMVGKPYQIDHKEWACPVAMVGLHGVFPDMHGVDSWHALTLAMQIIRRLLTYFVEDGGRLLEHINGPKLAIEDIFAERESEIPTDSLPKTSKNA